MTRIARVLAVAGSDSGGGAGIQADLKTYAAFGVYGMTAVTATTAQNTRGVLRVGPVAPELVAAQMRAVMDDLGVDAIKIGMLPSAGIMRAVAAILAEIPGVPVVLDPVMRSSSGQALMDPEA